MNTETLKRLREYVKNLDAQVRIKRQEIQIAMAHAEQMEADRMDLSLELDRIERQIHG